MQSFFLFTYINCEVNCTGFYRAASQIIESEIVSKVKFEAIDISILSGVSILLEVVISLSYNAFGYRDGYVISLSVVIGLIAIYRWNWAGVIPPILAGIASIITGAMIAGSEFIRIGNILSYTVGCLPLLLSMLWFKERDKKEMSQDYKLMFAYYFTGYLAYEVGRAICQVIDYHSFMQIGNLLIKYVVTDLLNVCFGALVFFIALKQGSIVYDMNIYIKEAHEGTPTSRIRDEIQDYNKLESMAGKDEVSDIALLDGGMVSDKDLELLEETRRRLEKGESKFDKEKKALEEYRDKKSKRNNVSKTKK